MKYRKKSLVIEAVKWIGTNLDELKSFVPEEFRHNKIHQEMGLITLEGIMFIKENDYIIKGIAGEFYLCKPDIFEKSYDPIVIDGNVHVMPDAPPQHIESKDCWCVPDMIEDHTNDGGVKCYLHKEIQ